MNQSSSTLKPSPFRFAIVLSLSLFVSKGVNAEDFGVQVSTGSVCQAAPLTEYQPVPPLGSGTGPINPLPPDEIEPLPGVVNYECLANNIDCAVFFAIQPNPNFAQDQAMRLCFSFGLPCRPLGCHRLP